MRSEPFLALTGQVAMVAGAATGIGEAVARRLARESPMQAVQFLRLQYALQINHPKIGY